MKKEDFHKGQTVWVYLIGNAARGRKTTEERIQEWEVVTVGKKYITAKVKNCRIDWIVKFEIENNFRQNTTYTPSYVLYLSKEDIIHDVWQSQTREYIRNCVRWESLIVSKMSDEDLQAVADIFRKYDKEGEQK